jgi:hypothetical protein
MNWEYDDNGLPFANIQGQSVDNFANPTQGGSLEAAEAGPHYQAPRLALAGRLPLSQALRPEEAAHS